MKLMVEIEMDNAAFKRDDETGDVIKVLTSGTEPARILRRLADRIQMIAVVFDGDEFPLFDINGNRVGMATVAD